MDILGCIDYLAQRGELVIAGNQVAFLSDELGIELHLAAYDRRSYEQALRECVSRAKDVVLNG